MERATENMMTLNRKAGTEFGDSVHDGGYAEYTLDPPLRVLLNLMGTLFLDLEALWWVYRRGTSSQTRPKRSLVCKGCNTSWRQYTTRAGRLRIDEALN